MPKNYLSLDQSIFWMVRRFRQGDQSSRYALLNLDEYMEQMSPKNNFLWVATESEEEEMAIMKKVEKWSRNNQ
jgi:hypothetical protein